MPTLLQFGAGNIGRGFIAPLFSAAGWRVVFVEADARRAAALRQRGRYRVLAVDGVQERVQEVGPVDALDAGDLPAVAATLAGCDLAATAVGLAALPRLAPAIAAGLERRARPLDVLVCENGARACADLRRAVAALTAAPFGAVRTAIGRMIPAPAADADALDIAVEPYAHLPVEAAAFTAPPPAVPGLEPRGDFDLVLGQKLHLHNLTHACLAYAGARAGCTTIPACMDRPALVAAARAAGGAAAEALARAHGRGPAGVAAVRRECLALLDDLLRRYRNRRLADPVARVGRDPWRKLAADDRLVGAARLCLATGVDPAPILDAVLDACAWRPADDEPDAARFRALAAQGPAAVLAAATALPPEDPFMTAIDLHHRRAQAAAAMRAAGLILRDDEAARLELADFGLARWGEFGLAIHVYVNTARCCAKELVMLPGQCCPEHRHPPVDGEPGKEETFRVRQGAVDLYLPGAADEAARAQALARLPADKRGAVTVFRRVHLGPGEQCTLPPDTPHWFVAGDQGAVVSEFSTCSRDQADIFTDPVIRRVAG